jgi:hypothetical protein
MRKLKDASLVGVRNFNAQNLSLVHETWEEAHISMNCSGFEQYAAFYLKP